MTPETVRAATLGADAPAAAAALGPLQVPAAYQWHARVPRTADMPRRALAFAADAAIVFFLAWLAVAAAATLGLLRIPDVTLFGRLNDAFGLLWLVSIFELPIQLAYFTLLESRTGRTPGKLLLGLRVQRQDGGRPTIGDSFLRNLLRLLWVTPTGPAFIVLDLWALQSTELDQRMGDLAAGTLVIDERFDVERA